MIKAIFFDFDGVIKDSVKIKTLAFSFMFEQYGTEVVTEIIRFHENNGGLSRFVKLKHYYNDLLGIEISENDLMKKAEQFSELVKQKVIDSEFIPGAYEFLNEKYKEFDLFIVTGTPQEEINEIMNECGLESFFISAYGSPAIKEDIIIQIMLRYGYSRQEVVFIGDAMTDYDAAFQNGIRFIGCGESSWFPEKTLVLDDLSTLDYCIDHMNLATKEV